MRTERGHGEISDPGQPHEGVMLSAQFQPQPGYFCQAPGDQGGACVGTKAQPVGDTGSNGQYVLGRPSQLHTHHILGGVGAKALAVQGIGKVLCNFRAG